MIIKNRTRLTDLQPHHPLKWVVGSLLFVIGLAFFGFHAFADSDPLLDKPDKPHKSLKDSAFVIETDKEAASDSLNRVAGQIDLGFSSTDHTYQSESHHRPGPFTRQEEYDNRYN